MPSDDPTRTDARLFAVLTLAFGAFVVLKNAQPTVVFVGTGILLLVYFGGTLATIEIADRLRIHVRNTESDDEEE
ncbi:hypothetical protein Halru_2617 [Halovivax ruber XH-70]|uniref:Uncharacterized protein n=2 Tax=Halovivax TaxID=332951 RepID=L0IG41_HALRX|nr:hypothetical protein [Halovivax ruber]AGB17196.1 hypothetical protein Halru_2617 [Halovivax ruber XH-70]